MNRFDHFLSVNRRKIRILRASVNWCLTENIKFVARRRLEFLVLELRNPISMHGIITVSKRTRKSKLVHHEEMWFYVLKPNDIIQPDKTVILHEKINRKRGITFFDTSPWF